MSALRVVGYVRVSTDEQAEGGISLKAQPEKIRAYCDLYGLTLVDVFTDAGESGKTLDRPGLAAARAVLDSGHAQGLVVAKLDRLTRSVADLGELLKRHFDEAAGKHLFSVADSIDTRTAGGRLVLNVLMSVSQWERETIVERTRDALAHKRRQGERTGSVPYGFDLDPGGPVNRKNRPQRLVPNAAERAVIQRMISLRSRRVSHAAIARELNAGGVPTKTGKGPWYAHTVKQILFRKISEVIQP